MRIAVGVEIKLNVSSLYMSSVNFFMQIAIGLLSRNQKLNVLVENDLNVQSSLICI